MANPSLKIPAEHQGAHRVGVDARSIATCSSTACCRTRTSAARRRASSRPIRTARQETLLSVPIYDFNWQTTYELAAPKRLPAGTQGHAQHDVRQLDPEQGEPGPEPRSAVGPADVGRDAVRRGALPLYRRKLGAEGNGLAHARIDCHSRFWSDWRRTISPALFFARRESGSFAKIYADSATVHHARILHTMQIRAYSWKSVIGMGSSRRTGSR